MFAREVDLRLDLNYVSGELLGLPCGEGTARWERQGRPVPSREVVGPWGVGGRWGVLRGVWGVPEAQMGLGRRPAPQAGV